MQCSICQCICCNHTINQRYVVVFLSSLAVIIAFGQRVNVSLIITEMVKPSNTSVISEECPMFENVTALAQKKNVYAWSQYHQGVILSSFFAGYVIFHIPAGYLADRFGARYVFCLSILASSVFTLFTPIIVKYTNWIMFAFSRGCIGIAQASIFPPTTALMSRWVPKTERTFLGAVLFAALSFGVIFGTLFTGIIKTLTDSWEMVFYFWGLIGFIWFIIGIFYVYSGPDDHPHVTEAEKTYLESVIVQKMAKATPNPLVMLSDGGIWALTAGQFGHAYMIFFLATNMPKYFKDVLHMNIKKNTLVSSLPYFLQWASSLASGRAGDWMIKKKGFSVVFIRKSYTTVASVFPSLCLLIMPYLGCNPTGVVVLLCIALLAMGPFYCGLKVNILDITVNFAGITMAFVNGIGAFSGIISPYIVAFLAPNNALGEWKIVMWVMFVVATLTNVAYIIWGTAERSSWDMTPDEWVVYKKGLDDAKAEAKAKKEAKKAEKKAKKEAQKG